jgi:hypothetical protein
MRPCIQQLPKFAEGVCFSADIAAALTALQLVGPVLVSEKSCFSDRNGSSARTWLLWQATQTKCFQLHDNGELRTRHSSFARRSDGLPAADRASNCYSPCRPPDSNRSQHMRTESLSCHSKPCPEKVCLRQRQGGNPAAPHCSETKAETRPSMKRPAVRVFGPASGKSLFYRNGVVGPAGLEPATRPL